MERTVGNNFYTIRCSSWDFIFVEHVCDGARNYSVPMEDHITMSSGPPN